MEDAGWKNSDGTWTEKAKEAGVNNDGDFLRNPEAQEQALIDALKKYYKELKTNGALNYVGKTITDSAGNQLAVTESGLMAGAHKEGAKTVHEYLDAASNGSLRSPLPDP